MSKPFFHKLDKWADCSMLSCEKVKHDKYVLEGRLYVYPERMQYRFVGSDTTGAYSTFDDLKEVLQRGF